MGPIAESETEESKASGKTVQEAPELIIHEKDEESAQRLARELRKRGVRAKTFGRTVRVKP